MLAPQPVTLLSVLRSQDRRHAVTPHRQRRLIPPLSTLTLTLISGATTHLAARLTPLRQREHPRPLRVIPLNLGARLNDAPGLVIDEGG